MKILLDTHILIWLLNNDDALSKEAQKNIDNAEEINISIASFWEIAIKISLKKLKVDLVAILKEIEKFQMKILPVTTQHLLAVSQLPLHHGDPFDRMLIAQAMTEPLHLMTADQKLAAYSDLVMVV
jgi:PIN domain nuclease of toxin-antitoxin system